MTLSIHFVFARHWHSLTRVRVLSAKSCSHKKQSQGLVVVYGIDPQVGHSLDGPSFSLSSELCLCNSFYGYFVPHSKKEQIIHTLVFLLEFYVFCKLYLGYSKFLGYLIHLSVSAYHMYSFVTGLLWEAVSAVPAWPNW